MFCEREIGNRRTLALKDLQWGREIEEARLKLRKEWGRETGDRRRKTRYERQEKGKQKIEGKGGKKNGKE